MPIPTWASALHHALYVAKISETAYPMRKRRICRCGCRKKITHSVYANGIALASGCELEAHRKMKELQRIKQGREVE